MYDVAVASIGLDPTCSLVVEQHDVWLRFAPPVYLSMLVTRNPDGKTTLRMREPNAFGRAHTMFGGVVGWRWLMMR